MLRLLEHGGPAPPERGHGDVPAGGRAGRKRQPGRDAMPAACGEPVNDDEPVRGRPAEHAVVDDGVDEAPVTVLPRAQDCDPPTRRDRAAADDG